MAPPRRRTVTHGDGDDEAEELRSNDSCRIAAANLRRRQNHGSVRTIMMQTENGRGDFRIIPQFPGAQDGSTPVPAEGVASTVRPAVVRPPCMGLRSSRRPLAIRPLVARRNGSTRSRMAAAGNAVRYRAVWLPSVVIATATPEGDGVDAVTTEEALVSQVVPPRRGRANRGNGGRHRFISTTLVSQMLQMQGDGQGGYPDDSSSFDSMSDDSDYFVEPDDIDERRLLGERVTVLQRGRGTSAYTRGRTGTSRVSSAVGVASVGGGGGGGGSTCVASMGGGGLAAGGDQRGFKRCAGEALVRSVGELPSKVQRGISTIWSICTAWFWWIPFMSFLWRRTPDSKEERNNEAEE